MVVACTRDCYDTCIFTPKAAGGRLLDLAPTRSFPTLGFTCARGRADVKRLYSGARLKRPLMRRGDQFVEISWERAVQELALRLRGADPQRVLHIDYDGNQGLLTWYYPARLFNAIGASSTDYSICSAEGHSALKLHWGRSWGLLPEELAAARAVVFWGVNALVSFIHGWALTKRARRAAVDVVMTETLKASDLPVVVRPGTDVVLALGIARRIIDAEAYDRRFIERYTYGFDEFKRYVQKFTDQVVEEETGVTRDVLDGLTEMYLSGAKTVIGFALGRTLNGGEAIRAISLIHALLGDPLGFFYSNSGAWEIDFDYLRGYHVGRPSRVVPMGLVGRQIGEFDVVYVWNANPVMTLPQGDRICEAAARGDIFLAVHDIVMSETAQCADLVLPAPTYLEKDDVVYSYWHQLLVYNKAVVEPIGESKPEHWVVREVGKAMGLGDHVLLSEDPWRAVDIALRKTGVSLDLLIRRRVVAMRRGDPLEFPTPTRKLEFYSTQAAKAGLSPLPSYERPSGRPTLVFTSDPKYTNTQFFDEYGEPEPVVYSNPRQAPEGVVCLERDGVAVKVKLRWDPEVPEGVLLARGIFKDLAGRPVSSIVDGTPNPYGGTPRINSTVVAVRNCE